MSGYILMREKRLWICVGRDNQGGVEGRKQKSEYIFMKKKSGLIKRKRNVKDCKPELLTVETYFQFSNFLFSVS